MGGVIMSNAALKGNTSGTGTVTLQSPNTNTDRTITLPDADGTAMVSGNMPAFSAYLSSNQVISTGVDTKVQFNTETFDTANCYDNTTNYRFTPTVAGYYEVTVAVRDQTGATAGTIRANIWKNGSVYSTSIVSCTANGNTSATTNLIYMNGSTDYLEGYMFQNSGSNMNCHGLQQYTYFQAAMVRSA